LFITFHLSDSLPLSVLGELKKQREREIKSLQNDLPDERYKIEVTAHDFFRETAL